MHRGEHLPDVGFLEPQVIERTGELLFAVGPALDLRLLAK